MALLPGCCCLVHCAMQGRSIGEVYLPASQWNDELFYFKQTEAIVNFGYPRGYFGFNESHALKLSFAAWSPVLLLPWILWGLVFGWNLMSPVICNIVLLTAAVFCFVWLVRPTWKQMGVLTLLFCLYTPFVRYMLSGMPEVICFSLLIVFYGLAVRYLEQEHTLYLVLLFLVSGLLVLMRPYMLLFLMLPVCLWMKRDKWRGALGAAFVTLAVLGCYALIKHYLGAEYFAPLFFTDWITAFVEKGIWGGIRNFFSTLYWMGKGFLGMAVEGFRSGLASGAFFGGYLVVMAVLLWQSIMDFMKLRRISGQEKEQPGNARFKSLRNATLIEGHLAFCYVGMLFALLLMYKLTEGSKHLLTFLAVGVFVISLMETKTYKKAVLVGAVFAYLYSYKAVASYDYQIPFATQEEVAKHEEWAEIFDREISFAEEGIPNYDNVMIWMFNDTVAEKNNTEQNLVNTKWQLLYALPEGMGINCCEKDYVADHMGELKSRYIALPAGGETDAACKDAGYRELARDQDMAVYQMRSSP
ncbi:MAG: hypothetical protein NC094_08335 [Bacteroidales bacterium]|nr:hypothetical protein [Lachnoclostridium sp.]MCM1383097.1 hypothetical protein [Lachnoclostridium sp.]MCM1465411.1 hypothetical protein [Bacteroidales bacterium]